MKRIVLAGLAGAIVYFVWQMAAWMFIPIHGPTVAQLPDEGAVRDVLVGQNLETKVYVAPWFEPEDMGNPESESMKNHESGPLFSIYYHKGGDAPMSPKILITGFITDFLAAGIVAMLLCCAVSGCMCQSYWSRVGFVMCFGIFLALTGHVSYYNWMKFPMDYTAMFVVDAIVGWFLAGLAIAAIVKNSGGGANGNAENASA